MNDEKHLTHGGRREGAGRKPAGTEAVKIRLTPAQRAVLSDLGGSAYLQKHLEELMHKSTIALKLTEAEARTLDSLGSEWLERERAEMAEYNRREAPMFIIDSHKGYLVVDSVGGFERDHCDGQTYDEWLDREGFVDDLLEFRDRDDALACAKEKLAELQEENDPSNEDLIENFKETVEQLTDYVDDFEPMSEVAAIGTRLSSIANHHSKKVIVFTEEKLENTADWDESKWEWNTPEEMWRLKDVSIEFAHILAERLNITEQKVCKSIHNPKVKYGGGSVQANPPDSREFSLFEAKTQALDWLDSLSDADFCNPISSEELEKFREVINTFDSHQ